MNDVVLAFDTATSATAVALTGRVVECPIELRDDPEPGRRPGHAQQLLALARRALDGESLRFSDVDRIVVGTGPGSFTGLRIGLATARALALASGAEIVGVSTLRVLASPALDAIGSASVVAPILDARRGEVFVEAFRGPTQVLTPRAVSPQRLVEIVQEGGAWSKRVWLAVGDGAVRFRSILEPVGISIPADASPLHRVSALVLAELGTQATPVPRAEVLPDYLRLPDAEITLRARSDP